GQTPDPKLEIKDVDKKIAYVDGMIIKRDQQRSALAKLNSANPVLAAYATVEAKQKSWFDAVKAYSLAHQRTAVVQRFVDFVGEHGIEPITQYARDEWPQKPWEFFAEAYSWFLTKPLDLKALSPKLHGWFAEKKYR
ncbi:MAG TPA: hypothetical protein VFY65_12705, partial [Longimicrobium sp.]|nr:hypothetical protein [Longimicrobium sp.]